jgi:hypothetical protein
MHLTHHEIQYHNNEICELNPFIVNNFVYMNYPEESFSANFCYSAHHALQLTR